MSDENAISPFEIGVLAAMQLIGKAVAMNPHLDMEQFKKDANALMTAMPNEPSWKGGLGVHQAAIDSLLRGAEKVDRK
jgi:hypothetical protein